MGFRCSAVNEDGVAYLMKDGVDVIYQISTQTALSWYTYTYKDVVSVMNILPYINDVSSVELVLGGKTYLFEMSGEDDELVVTCDGQTLDTDIFRKLYQLLLSIKNNEYLEEPGGCLRPDLPGKPDLQLQERFPSQRPSGLL